MSVGNVVGMYDCPQCCSNYTTKSGAHSFAMWTRPGPVISIALTEKANQEPVSPVAQSGLSAAQKEAAARQALEQQISSLARRFALTVVREADRFTVYPSDACTVSLIAFDLQGSQPVNLQVINRRMPSQAYMGPTVKSWLASCHDFIQKSVSGKTAHVTAPPRSDRPCPCKGTNEHCVLCFGTGIDRA